mgnify:CR=1 FL=1
MRCCQDLFGFGSVQELLAAKDQQSFTAFERGELSEAERLLRLPAEHAARRQAGC